MFLQKDYTTENNVHQGCSDILHDYSAGGKERKWKEKKERTELLSMVYDSLARKESSAELAERYRKRALRLRKCGRVLTFNVLADGSKRLKSAQFCRIRLCPMCSWRRSLKIYTNMSKIMEQLKKERKYRFLFLTLTIRNTKATELNDTILKMQRAFGLLYRRKEFESIKGWYRGLEVTYNKRRGDFHPHYHVILAVEKSYFDDGYVTQQEWSQIWGSCLGVDYNPRVDIRKVRGNTAKAVSECAKYTVKDSEYLLEEDLEFSQKLVRILDEALDRKRLVAYGGILKEIHKQLKLGDEVDGDLTHTDEDKLQEGAKMMEVTYVWNTGYMNYFRRLPVEEEI